MATPLQTFRLFDATQQPLTGVSPTFRVYANAAGTNVSPHPTITEISIGEYGFVFDDDTAIRVWQVDGGSTAVPRYIVGGNNGDVQVFGTYDVTGAPGTPGGGSPNFLLYADINDVSKTPPSILNPATGFYFFVPSSGDIDAGRAFVVRSDSNGLLLPISYAGTVGNLPTGSGPPTSQTIESVTASADVVTVVLSSDGTLTGDSLNPAKWLIGGGGTAMTVTGVSISGPTIILATTESTTGASYILYVPQGIVDTDTGNPCLGAFVQPFTGVGEGPGIYIAQTIDTRQVRVIFTKSVMGSDAVIASNYSIDHGLGVTSVTQESDRSFILHTTVQTPGTVYTITISNIRDLAGNPI